MEDGKLEYREMVRTSVRFSQVEEEDDCLLPGHTQADNLHVTTELTIKENKLEFYGYIEDQPEEWSQLDYSIEVTPPTPHCNVFHSQVGTPPLSLVEFILQWCCGIFRSHLKTFKVGFHTILR